MDNITNKNVKNNITQIFINHYVFIFFIIFIIFAYFLYSYYLNITTNVIIIKPTYLKEIKNNEIYSVDKITNPASLSSSYSVWIYLNKRPTSNESTTIFRYWNGGNNNIFLKLYIDEKNNLYFINNITTRFSVLKSFPIQIWTHIFVNIYNMEYYEFYINGKIENTFKEQNPDKTNNIPKSGDYWQYNKITVGDDGNPSDVVLNDLVRYPYTKNSDEVLDKYNIGNNMNKTSYDFKIFIKQDNDVAYKTINMFNFTSLNNVFS
jgi:hypothetical protein